MDNLTKEIKWRGSTYAMDKVEGGKVFWTNTTSRYSSTCSIDAWKKSDPYDGRYA